MKNLILILAFLFLYGCGGESPAPKGEADSKSGDALPGQVESIQFDCNYTKCDSGRQYCLLSKKNNVYLTTECMDKPAALSDCEGARADAPKHFSTSGNCSSVIACSQNNSAFTVTCYAP